MKTIQNVTKLKEIQWKALQKSTLEHILSKKPKDLLWEITFSQKCELPQKLTNSGPLKMSTILKKSSTWVFFYLWETAVGMKRVSNPRSRQ